MIVAGRPFVPEEAPAVTVGAIVSDDPRDGGQNPFDVRDAKRGGLVFYPLPSLALCRAPLNSGFAADCLTEPSSGVVGGGGYDSKRRDEGICINLGYLGTKPTVWKHDSDLLMVHLLHASTGGRATTIWGYGERRTSEVAR